MKIVSILMNTVVHIVQAVMGTICVFSVISLVYFTLMSTLENRYQYAIVAGICLAFSVFFYYITEKIKEKCGLFH